MKYDVSMKFACRDAMSLAEVESSPEEWFNLWLSCIPIDGGWNMPCVRCWKKRKNIDAVCDAAQACHKPIQLVGNSRPFVKHRRSEVAATAPVGEPLRDLGPTERAALLARNIAKFDADVSKIRDCYHQKCGFCGIPIQPVASEIVGIQYSCCTCAVMCKTLSQRPYWVEIRNAEHEENRRRAKDKQRMLADDEGQKFL